MSGVARVLSQGVLGAVLGFSAVVLVFVAALAAAWALNGSVSVPGLIHASFDPAAGGLLFTSNRQGVLAVVAVGAVGAAGWTLVRGSGKTRCPA